MKCFATIMRRKRSKMSDITVFENKEFGSVRTMEINGEPYFVGKDIAVILGYAKPENAIANHVDAEDKTLTPIQGGCSTGIQNTTIINESGLYSLILSSKLPKAKEFKRWVTSEVLPTIRKTGGYVNNEDLFINTYLPYADDSIKMLFKTTLSTINQLNDKINKDKPYVDFARHVTESSDAIGIGEFAKIIKNENIKIGRNKLFDWLRSNGYLMSNNTPYQKYINNGYFDVIEAVRNTPYGIKVFPKTLITGKGQIILVEKLRSEFGEAV